MNNREAVVLVFKRENASPKEISLLAAELAWQALGRLTGESVEKLKEEGVALQKLASGKPVWSGIDAHLSITHTNDTAAAAAAFFAIGIDIEYIDRQSDKAAKRLFSESERLWLRDQQKNGRQGAFAALWTLREAYAKWTGLGLAGMPQVEFTVNQNGAACSDKDCVCRTVVIEEKKSGENRKKILSIVADFSAADPEKGLITRIFEL